jgi:hypothetical protein
MTKGGDVTSKIRIKVGTTEIEFEGSEEYMREELPGLVELLNDIAPTEEPESEEVSEILPEGDPSKQTLKMTTNTIATKLSAKTGSELALAACAHLCLVKGNDTYKRANILAEMKLATNFYKKTYSGNLSKSLKKLVADGKLLETAQDTYALDAKEKSDLQEKLSGS